MPVNDLVEKAHQVLKYMDRYSGQQNVDNLDLLASAANVDPLGEEFRERVAQRDANGTGRSFYGMNGGDSEIGGGVGIELATAAKAGKISVNGMIRNIGGSYTAVAAHYDIFLNGEKVEKEDVDLRVTH